MSVLEKPTERPRLPEWLYRRLAPAGQIQDIKGTLESFGLHTVCESALCPNRQECWSRGTATFMILGDVCTRSCGFCAVKNGLPYQLDKDEPEKVARAVKEWQLKHIVITSVARDELKDEGSNHFASTIYAVREVCPEVTIEVLTPDFSGREELLEIVANAKPDIFNHNLETVRRLTPSVRSKATYDNSLHVLKTMRDLLPDKYIKSGIMVGLGETENEIFHTMDDLRKINCDILTIGQYIQPTRHHLEVKSYYPPEKFREYKEIGLNKGFRQVVSSPLARSSYHAEEILHKNNLSHTGGGD